MSWETVDALPGARTDGGAFRGGAEPVVAERTGVTLRERARLFWHSSPEHPLERVAERVVVTPNHVYVQRSDGLKARVGLDRLHGERLDGGRVIYGVHEGDDLLLPYRTRCEVQNRLAAAVRGGHPIEPWRGSDWLLTAALGGPLLIAIGVACYLAYPFASAWAHIEAGLYTAESVIGTLGAVATFLVGVFVFLWMPSRWRVDAVAVTRTRGVPPWLSFSIPPTEVASVELRRATYKPKNQARVHNGWWVDLVLQEPRRFGSITKTRRVPLERFRFERLQDPESKSRCHEEAQHFARRVALLVGIDR